MITLLTGLLASKWGKYVLELVVVLGLVFGAYKWAESHGKSVQKETDDQHQAQEIETNRKVASDAKDQLVSQATAAASAADARSQQAQAQFAQLAAVVSSLNAKAKAGKDQVDGLKDSDLHGDIVSKLGVRPPGDTTVGYVPAEERAIDDAVTQYPIAKQENAALSGQVDAKTAEAKANRDVADANAKAIAADEGYIGILQKSYQDIYNQHPPRYRSGKCLFLWNCGRKEVKLPLPGEK